MENEFIAQSVMFTFCQDFWNVPLSVISDIGYNSRSIIFQKHIFNFINTQRRFPNHLQIKLKFKRYAYKSWFYSWWNTILYIETKWKEFFSRQVFVRIANKQYLLEHLRKKQDKQIPESSLHKLQHKLHGNFPNKKVLKC